VSGVHTATGPWSLAAMRVKKRSGARAAAAAEAAATFGYAASQCSVTQVGGASSMSPSSRRERATPGRIQAWSWISPRSITTAAEGAGARKNHVRNRLGAINGGVQCENGISADDGTTSPASSDASRTAAFAAAVSSSAPATRSPSSMRPPGNTHMPPNARREFLRSMSVSSPPGPSRSRTTVAAWWTSAMIRFA